MIPFLLQDDGGFLGLVWWQWILVIALLGLIGFYFWAKKNGKL